MARQRPTTRHFHNQPELRRGDSCGLMLRWIFLGWLASCGPLGNTVKQDGCTFPSRWQGKWFQSGVIQPIVIEGNILSNKGRCLSSEGDKFLIVDEKGCYRCVVMHEKHINVLQYKETFCHRRDALPHLCSLITGDALLYSMFRENAEPVDCPLKAPFSFTYNRGHGDCKFPASSIESCTEDSRLLLNYQACPDVYGSESTVEELECLATWKEGSLRFLVGKLHHNHATSNEDRYRCFVYEKTNGIGSAPGLKDNPVMPGGVEYRVAQSGDATCNGLFSATEGSRTMALKRVSVKFNCQFPSWMTFSHTWHTLDFTSNYTFYQRNATLRITNHTGAEVKVFCVNVKASSPSGNSVALVAHWQHHCVSRYVCVVLYRRDTYIAELQRGSPTSRPDEACSPHHFNAVTAPYITLVASNPESKECPYSGKYTISNHRHQRSISSNHRLRSRRDNPVDYNHRVNSSRMFNFSLRNISEMPILRSKRNDEISCVSSTYSKLEVGCNTAKNMEFYSTCDNKELVTAYTCHGGWYENGASFVVTTPVTRDSTAARRYCFVSRDARDGVLAVGQSATNCERGVDPEPLLFDASFTGKCQDETNKQPLIRIPSPYIIYIAPIVLHYIIPR
ncbi:uncharacterized protein LOC110998393 isoform X1 [Pieris rapae]|uniref:uncharacterized protein LOC110998393 isoform X1 n=1 Tax=Pieris rapae TaxID=64459 RepID=UPI001E2804A8|nr:uncharacterized protein LOC110998393 isoform X1 [Pieris rapae]XP_045487520.1 uncharacterized protein LOC110998393 isoform X1 [Pieris rapae]XP_045487521.1 uncharacterized protein LOC110998393 isoform X1 [Pieris rapae]